MLWLFDDDAGGVATIPVGVYFRHELGRTAHAALASCAGSTALVSQFATRMREARGSAAHTTGEIVVTSRSTEERET